MTGKFLHISPGFAAWVCLLCCVDRSGIMVPFLISAFAHECGHLIALGLLRIPVYGISLCASGAIIQAGLTGKLQECWAILAGPIVNLILFLFCFRSCPIFGICNAIQLIWNLLPVYPLDGGRLCHLLLPRMFGRIGVLLCHILQWGTLLLITAFGIWGTCVLHYGLLPILIAGFFLFRLSNSLDKQRDYWYNK